jgi:cytidylate kinase
MSYLFRGRAKNPRQDKEQRAVTNVLPETTWNTEPLPNGTPPENKVVVTISRQFGSGGAEVGHIVAQESGLLYVDQSIIAEVAKRLGINEEQAARQDEQAVGEVGHILEALRSSSPFNLHYNYLFKPGNLPTQAQEIAYLRLTQRVLLELATEGDVVIIGRGSQFLLRGAARTLHIYIFAPLDIRIEQVMNLYHVNRNSAKEMIDRRDYEHNAYLGRYYGGNQHQPYLYHLLINTGLFTYELAADLIKQAIPIIKEIGESTFHH